MSRKETIKKWHNYFTSSLERGLTWNKIRLNLILRHKYKASLIEKLIYNYRIERAIKQKKRQKLAIGVAACFLIMMLALPFFLKPSILGMVLGGGTNTDYLEIGNGVNIVFVDINNPNCKDSHTRTQALSGLSPWCTLDAPLTNDKLLSGDTLYIGAGEYNGESDISRWSITSNITISAYPGDEVILTRFYQGGQSFAPNSLWKSEIVNGEIIWYTALDSSSTPHPRVYYKDTTKFFTWTNYDNFLASNYPENSWYDSSSDLLYVKFSDKSKIPNSIPIYISSEYQPLYINDNSMSSQAYIIIKNITFKYLVYGISIINQANVILDNCKIYGGHFGIYVDGRDVQSNKNLLFKNNLLDGKQNPLWYGADMKNEATEETSGLYVIDFAGRVEAYNNQFIYWHGGVLLSTDSPNECDNSEIHGNTFRYGRGSQIEIENYCSNTKYHDNKIFDTDYAGVSFAPADASAGRCEFYNNLIFANNKLRWSATTGNENNYAIKAQSRVNLYNNNWYIHHNTFYGYGRSLNTMEMTSSGVLPGAWANTVWKDNIFYAEKEYALFRTGLSGDGVFYDYNLYYLGGSGLNLFQRWNNNNAIGYKTLAFAKGSSDWDGTWDIHSQQANPLFIDAANGDFRPQAGSPVCTMSSTGSYVGALPCEGEPLPPEPFCGDDSCNGLENCSTCSSDCGICPLPEPYCGDLTCDADENCSTCEADCGICPEEQQPLPICGDGSCNDLENCSSCEAYCDPCPIVPVCGDGSCNGAENCTSCSSDCGACPVIPVCGDNECNGDENCSTCVSDCGDCPIIYYCGDNACNNNENCSACEVDCGACPVSEPFCGDGSCNGNENCTICNLDCGNCTIAHVCGDEICEDDIGETCASCASDCGACPKKKSSGGGGSSGGSTLRPQTNASNNNSSTNLIGQAITWVKETVKEAEEKVRQELGEEQPAEPEAIITEPAQETPGEVELGTREHNPALFTSIIILMIIILIGAASATKSHYPKLKRTLLNVKERHKSKKRAQTTKIEPETELKSELKSQKSMQKPKDLSISGLKNNSIEELAKLHKYTTEAANRGYSRERVTNELLGVGWDQHLVGVLLSMHDSEFIPEEVPEPPLSQSTESTQTVSRSTNTVNPNIGNSIIKWTEFEDIK